MNEIIARFGRRTANYPYLCLPNNSEKEYPLLEGLEITTLAAEGKAMGRWNEQVVFVPMTVPGDVVDVQIRTKRRRYMEGYVVRYVRRSPLRVEPFCEHFGVCGGCKWQNLPYDEQLRFKREQVRDQLTRIGKVELPEIAPCLGSARTQFYRNKLEFTFADRRWLTYEEVASGAELDASPAVGFHIPGMFDKVLDIHRCWLQPEPSNAIRLEAKRFCVEHGYTFHNAREHSGLMRNMIIRTASTGEVMVIVVFGQEDMPRIEALLDHLAAAFPAITSLFYVVNTKWNDSVGDLQPVCYRGKDHIIEQMEGLRFKVGPKSFYQTNSQQALELYRVARDFAQLGGDEVLYDLYTGTGTIANFCAARCALLCGRHEGGARRRLRCGQRTPRRHHPRPAACRGRRAGAGGHPACGAPADCLCELQPRHAGARPGAARRRLPRRGGAAGRHVPPYAPRRERREARAAVG